MDNIDGRELDLGIDNINEFISPGKASCDHFMGGASAGEILSNRTPVVSIGDNSQVSYEYFSNENDPGDTGELLEFAQKNNMSLIIKAGDKDKVRKGNIPHWLSFTKNPNGLYVSHTSGVFYNQESIDERDLIRVTSDKELANKMFEEISAMKIDSRGRDLFRIYSKYWKSDRGKIELDRK